MDEAALKLTAAQLVSDNKGLLAMDESTSTANKRFKESGIPETQEAREAYRNMIITTPGLSEAISGAILFDETIRQKAPDGGPFAAYVRLVGIIPGIKLDSGAKPLPFFPKEKVTEGLDGLRERIAEYVQMGARFAKWRAVITIGEGIPSRACIQLNAQILGRYAALCQEGGLVPVVEPEVLMDGSHSLDRCFEVTQQTLQAVFDELHQQRVLLEGMLLKPNMVLPALDAPTQQSVDEVADATVHCLLRTVPAAVPGVVFLSGGQTGELASARLNAMNTRFRGKLPWTVTFSYARAIQQPAMEIWAGKQEHIPAAQKALYHRALLNKKARAGEYSPSLEHQESLQPAG